MRPCLSDGDPEGDLAVNRTIFDWLAEERVGKSCHWCVCQLMPALDVMRGRRFVTLAAAVTIPMSIVYPAAAQPARAPQPAAQPTARLTACDPTQTTPVYRGKVPAPKDVIGFDL